MLFHPRVSKEQTEARKAYGTGLKPKGSHLRQFFRLEAAEKGLGRAGKPSLVTWDRGVDTTSLQPS